MASKERFLVLIAGSADVARAYPIPVINHAAAVAASGELGAALARKGFRLAVFSADPAYCESVFVRGFFRGLPSQPKKDRVNRIEIRGPISADMDFTERKSFPEVFSLRTDPSRGWRRSFMMALAEADAVILVGGDRMTETIGHAAAAFQIPVFALAGFGGAARQVWEDLQIGRPGGPLREEHELLAATVWSQADADKCAANLMAQIERQRAEDGAAEEHVSRSRRRLATRAAIGAVAGLIAIISAALASRHSDEQWANLALYILGPVGGFGAALVASSLQENPSRNMVHEGALGLVSGLLVSSVYLLAQMSSRTFKPEGFAFLFATLTGIAGGLTAQRVIRGWMAGKNKLPTGGRYQGP